MIATASPFERVIQSLPTELTGESRYVTDCGHVWTGNVWNNTLTSGGRRGRIVDGHIIPEPQVTYIEAAPKNAPPPERTKNRHERRRAAAKARKR